MAADGQRYAGPDASTSAARAKACVSTYSRMLISLPSRTVMAKIQSSSNGLSRGLVACLRSRNQPVDDRHKPYDAETDCHQLA
jgi:hypothetical protein